MKTNLPTEMIEQITQAETRIHANQSHIHWLLNDWIGRKIVFRKNKHYNPERSFIIAAIDIDAHSKPDAYTFFSGDRKEIKTGFSLCLCFKGTKGEWEPCKISEIKTRVKSIE